MAERRMFARTIIDSDAFIDMPITARLLYYDLGMRADDDGFVNSPKSIMRAIGASIDDLRILAAKKFIIEFRNGIIVIKHWKIHNYIRKDSYTETKYKELKDLLEFDENNSYRLKQVCDDVVTESLQVCDDVVTDMSTQVRIGKDRIGKDSIEREGERESAPTRKDKTNFKLYGICGNVRLTDAEMAELVKKYPTLYEDYIDRVSLHKKSEGREYENDFATVMKWIRQDKSKAKEKEKTKRKEDCINDTSEYGDDFGLFEGFKTSLDNAES